MCYNLCCNHAAHSLGVCVFWTLATMTIPGVPVCVHRQTTRYLRREISQRHTCPIQGTILTRFQVLAEMHEFATSTYTEVCCCIGVRSRVKARMHRSEKSEHPDGQVYRTGKIVELPQGLSCLGWSVWQCSTSHRPGCTCARNRTPVYRYAQIHW